MCVSKFFRPFSALPMLPNARMGTHVHNPAVDVAKLLEAKQPRAMSRVIEGERLRLLATLSFACPQFCGLTYGGRVDRHSARVRSGVRNLAWELALARPLTSATT